MICRGTLEKLWRVLVPDHRETLITSGNLAVSLSEQGKYADAAEIEREVLVQRARLLGAEHEGALISAFNLVGSLPRCGQNMECEQILRGTLALARRAIGPTHELAQEILARVRRIGLVTR